MKNLKNRFFSLTENNNVIGDYDRPRLIKMANVSPPSRQEYDLVPLLSA
jgi:hypothetical protein